MASEDDSTIQSPAIERAEQKAPEQDGAKQQFDQSQPVAQPQESDESDEHQEPEVMALVDELGVEDLTDILFGLHGKIFSAAGRDSPVAEFEEEGIFLRPAHKPYTEEPASEEIIYDADEKGILLDEFGERRKIIGAKFKGEAIYTLAEMKPGTLKHYAAWFDDGWVPHKFFVQGEALTADMIYRIRNRTHDGEISIFPEIRSEA